jgi:hypothetical protein
LTFLEGRLFIALAERPAPARLGPRCGVIDTSTYLRAQQDRGL